MRPLSLAYSVERRVPASCLLITPAVELANTVYRTLERDLGARVWVWHEPAVEPAVRALGVCRFRLILLDMATTNVLPGSVLRALREAAPETPLVLLAAGADTPLGIEQARLGEGRARLAGAAAVVPHRNSAALIRAVRRILAMPAPSGGS
jgi:CheY-like chemotaxis protein